MSENNFQFVEQFLKVRIFLFIHSLFQKPGFDQHFFNDFFLHFRFISCRGIRGCIHEYSECRANLTDKLFVTDHEYTKYFNSFLTLKPSLICVAVWQLTIVLIIILMIIFSFPIFIGFSYFSSYFISLFF